MKQLSLPQKYTFSIRHYILPFFYSYVERKALQYYVETVDIQYLTQDKSKQMEQGVQSKKLGNVIEKLRQVGSSN
ncbi:uncharacterized protein LOC143429259 [Xylocopa sonorina]|uniref:uncharacterized protein LOC143429259 n=1 Tax=Xylocopa sonorina TaxID=1818115 RepID=UPI00403A836F